MFQPMIFKLDNGKADILDKNAEKDDNIVLSPTINYPLGSLGFHTFIHRTKSAMSITKNLQTKNKFYYIVNPFESTIPNYQDSINNLTKIYLSIKDDIPEIVSRTFYKIWEMLFAFNLADENQMNIAVISDNTNAVMQAVINYRQKLSSGVSKDKIFNVSIDRTNEKYLESSKQFLGYYEENNPGLIKKAGHKGKEVADITSVKNISTFKKDIEKSKKFANLVIAEGSMNWNNELFQEQEAYQLILGEIISAIKVSVKSGNLILKIFETFTIPTIKLIYLLSGFYEETHIYKPFFSRVSDSERYIICKNFKYDQSKDSAMLNKRTKNMELVLERMGSNKFVFDIFPDLELPLDYIDKFKFINIKIVNPQQIMINEIVKYIKENNYFGEKYHTFRDNQINATKWWVSMFYPPSNNLLSKSKDDIQKLIKTTLEKYSVEQSKFVSSLVR
jgi:hypothetical protein